MKKRSTWLGVSGFAALLLLVSSSSHADLVTSNLLAWYKADAGMYTTATGATPSDNGDPVGRWEDQSGNDYHLRRSGTDLPTLSSTSGPMGTPALHFDGVSYLLMSTLGWDANRVSFPSGTDIGTVFMVLRPNSEITSSSSSSQVLLSLSGSDIVNSVMIGNTTGLLTDEVITVRDTTWNPTIERWQNQASGMTGASSISNTEYTFLSLTHAGNAFEIRTSLGGDDLTSENDGDPGPDGWTDFNLNSNTNPVPANVMTLRVGGVVETGIGRFNGYVSEIIVYDAELNPTERAQVEDYLSSRYVIPEPMTGVLVFLGAGVFLLRRRLVA